MHARIDKLILMDPVLVEGKSHISFFKLSQMFRALLAEEESAFVHVMTLDFSQLFLTFQFGFQIFLDNGIDHRVHRNVDEWPIGHFPLVNKITADSSLMFRKYIDKFFWS